MSNPFLGEIRLMAFSFPPKGWSFCNGQLLPINQNQALFSLLGTTYGGDGRVNFALPNLQGRTPRHVSGSLLQGQAGGEATHALTAAEVPVHTHGLNASNDLANASLPAASLPAAKGRVGVTHYAAAGTSGVSLDPAAVTPIGGNQPHNNQQPYLVANYVIALQGIFPSRN